MFKETEKNPQFDLFGSVSGVLAGTSLKEYSDDNGWHNRFREQVLTRIDESLFKVLFSSGMGAPNASISTMIGMMILKEAFGWSDARMYENSRFNLLVRSALGLLNLNDALPAESTYYLFRSRMYNYKKTDKVDLMALTFETITRNQVKEFKVNGESIRMDSKLFGSNIAFYSRYEVIHQTLGKFLKKVDTSLFQRLSKDEQALITELLSEDAQKTVYNNNKEQITKRLIPIGLLMLRLLKVYRKTIYRTDEYQLLKRVFLDQYETDGPHRITLLENEKISSGSVQSPHDPDASYRNKGNQKVKGYSVNVTETVTDGVCLDLITDVDVRKANTADTAFVKGAIKSTVGVTEQTVKTVYADGAYQSPANDNKKIDMVYTGIQGTPPRYELQEKTSKGLTLVDTQTGQIIQAEPTAKRKNSNGRSWTYTNSDGKRCYIKEEALRATEKRKQMKQRPPEELRKRNNVEATIFQLSYPLRNAKTKYRGLYKQQVWAYCRCLWINLVRIVNYEAQVC